MAELNDYRFHEGERYWPVPHYLPKLAEEGRTLNAKFWTITVHEQTCRYAKDSRRTASTEDVSYLAECGFDPPKRGQRVTWIGCKTCRTAFQPKEYWMAVGKAELEARRATEAAHREEERAEQRMRKAKKARETAIKDEQEDHYNRTYKREVDFDMDLIAAEVGARWDAENPELAALLESVKENEG